MGRGSGLHNLATPLCLQRPIVKIIDTLESQMPKTRRKSFDRAHALLEELRKHRRAILDALRASSSQLQPLRSLQTLLIKEISRAERKIRRSKAILKALDPAGPTERAAELEERIDFYRHLAYGWRCFGDAIAYMFLDKFALKQTYFNTHNINRKPDAGFLGDKAGLVAELKMLDRVLEHGFPAVLTDLTNTIRHGDVCVMIGPDPLLIEVKSGKLDSRGRRQRNSIRQLMEFFDTDEAQGLRGFEEVRRVSYQTDEVTYVEALNECMAAAIKDGAAWRSPEEGLYYVALANGAIGFEDILAELKLTQPMVFLLNEAKTSKSWSPYVPFTLSIRDKETLFRFIWGSIYLAVLYDVDALRRMAEAQGVAIVVASSDADFVFEITRPNGAGPLQVANQMFSRLAFDFTSPAWLFRTAIENLDRLNVESVSTTETPPIADASRSAERTQS